MKLVITIALFYVIYIRLLNNNNNNNGNANYLLCKLMKNVSYTTQKQFWHCSMLKRKVKDIYRTKRNTDQAFLSWLLNVSGNVELHPGLEYMQTNRSTIGKKLRRDDVTKKGRRMIELIQWSIVL